MISSELLRLLRLKWYILVQRLLIGAREGNKYYYTFFLPQICLLRTEVNSYGGSCRRGPSEDGWNCLRIHQRLQKNTTEAKLHEYFRSFWLMFCIIWALKWYLILYMRVSVMTFEKKGFVRFGRGTAKILTWLTSLHTNLAYPGGKLGNFLCCKVYWMNSKLNFS